MLDVVAWRGSCMARGARGSMELVRCQAGAVCRELLLLLCEEEGAAASGPRWCGRQLEQDLVRCQVTSWASEPRACLVLHGYRRVGSCRGWWGELAHAKGDRVRAVMHNQCTCKRKQIKQKISTIHLLFCMHGRGVVSRGHVEEICCWARGNEAAAWWARKLLGCVNLGLVWSCKKG